MFPFASRMRRSAFADSFIKASRVTVSGSTATPDYTGCAAGDFCLAIGVSMSSTGQPSGFVALGSSFSVGGASGVLWTKVLTAGDISSPGSFSGSSGGKLLCLVYRKPISASRLDEKSIVDTDTSKSVSGTKPARTRGLVVVCAAQGATVSSGQPSGMTLRDNTSGLAAADFTKGVKYPNGAALTWTSLSSTNGALALIALT